MPQTAHAALGTPTIVVVTPPDPVPTSSASPTWGGLTIEITATISAAAPNMWRGTEIRYRDSTTGVPGLWFCIDTADHGEGTWTETVAIPAPILEANPPGTAFGNLEVRIREGDATRACANGFSGISSPPIPIYIQENNPDLALNCGIDVTLILDESGSVFGLGSLADDIRNEVRDGAYHLWDALEGTGSTLAIVEFNTTARVPFVERLDISPGANRSLFETYIGAVPGNLSDPPINNAADPGFEPLLYGNPDYFANWEAAFTAAAGLPVPDDGVTELVIFFTGSEANTNDSYPTANDPSGSNISSTHEWVHASYAAFEATTVKEQGSHIFGLGIVNGSDPAASLPLVTGPQAFLSGGPVSMGEADWMISTDLGGDLRALVLDLCKASVTVTTETWDNNAGTWVATNGWQYTATAFPATVPSFAWTSPAPATDATIVDDSGDTGAPGTLLLQWVPAVPGGSTSIDIVETLEERFVFKDAVCYDTDNNEVSWQTPPTRPYFVSSPPAVYLDVNADAYFRCTFQNTEPLMEITTSAPQTTYGPGDQFTYTIDYGIMATADEFDSSAYQVELTDQLDDDLMFISATPTGNCSASGGSGGFGQLVTCSDLPVLTESGPPAGQVTISVEVQSSDSSSREVPNRACVDGMTAASGGTALQQSCDDWNITTPVTLAYFEATANGNRIDFDWSTVTESGNVGFNLYEVGVKGREKINQELIAATGIYSLSPNHYHFSASGLEGDVFYIEDLDVFGNANSRGPFHLGESFGTKPEVEVIDWSTIRAEHEAKEEDRRQEMGSQVSSTLDDDKRGIHGVNGGARTAHLGVREDGIYRITYEDLLSNGIDLSGVRAKHLAITEGKKKIPRRVVASGKNFGPGDYVEFIGYGIDTLYSTERVYTLAVDKRSARNLGGYNRRPSSRLPVTEFYLETVTAEENDIYFFGSKSDDPWFEQYMLTFTTPNSWMYSIEIDNYVEGAAEATLDVSMSGVTEWMASPDHHVRGSFNGEIVFDEAFDGVSDCPVNVELKEGALSEGENRLQVTLPGDSGVQYDMVAFDKLSVTYPRAFVAQDDQLSFEGAGKVFRIDGFSEDDVIVYRVQNGVPKWLKNRLVSSEGGGLYSAFFAGHRKQSQYFVATESRAMIPDIRPSAEVEKIVQDKADLLIIAHPDFIEGLDPLVGARKAEGYKVKIVNVNHVYSEYSNDIFDAKAIRAYIKDAAKKMGVEFVLLVGADTYDYHNYLGDGSISFVPSLYTETCSIVGYAPVDPLYGDLDLDGVPDIAVGRLPVRTLDELETVVYKILTYDEKGYGQTAVLASDMGFGAEATALELALPSGWQADQVSIDQQGVSGARERLIERINEGTALTSYSGHSGLTHWSEGLLLAQDVEELNNHGRPTVVTQFACWNTYYVDPRNQTMAHRYMLTGDNGAAAVMGATVLSNAEHERVFSLLLMPLLTEEGMPIGRAIVEAKQGLASSPIAPDSLADVIASWTLLGDPTMVISRP